MPRPGVHSDAKALQKTTVPCATGAGFVTVAVSVTTAPAVTLLLDAVSVVVVGVAANACAVATEKASPRVTVNALNRAKGVARVGRMYRSSSNVRSDNRASTSEYTSATCLGKGGIPPSLPFILHNR